MRNFLNTLFNLIKNIFKWIFTHKKLVFIYIPLVISVLVSLYVGYVYLNWRSDRRDAFTKMGRYKRLIDRTEEMKSGMVYRYQDVDSKAKVVDLPTRIYGRNGEVIGEFFEQKRELVPYKWIPKALVQAVVASEDREFYKHKGVNPVGIMRAFLLNMYHMRVVQGGSTITQQLAKNFFTNMERSLKRKIYEAFCAMEIEERYDKDDIMLMYLNLIYFGNGAYGVQSISKMYFGKSVKELNETECAVIVATISSPVRYSPLNNLKNSVRKTKRILKSLVDAGYLKKQKAAYQYERYIKKWDVKFDKEGVPQSSLIGSFVFSSYRIKRAPFFNEQIRRQLVKRFGEDIVKKGGLSVYTTIDGKKQDIALRALQDGVARQREYHKKKSKKIRNKKKAALELEKSKNIEGAFVVLDPYTGEIISYVGGYKFTSGSQLDHVVQSRRQPGSSFKPFVYCSAVQNKDITPATMMVDDATTFKGGYKPRNYSHKYRGKIIVQEALRRSVNIIAVKVLNKTGYDTLFDYLEKGLDFSASERKKRFKETLSLALGTYEISPIENAVMHSIIVNGGDYIKAYGIKRVEDYNKKVLWNNEDEIKEEIAKKREKYGKIIDPIAAAITVSMLKGVLKPGGTASWTARKYKITFPAAGKTGTSTNYNDAWFAGYTSELVSVVWVGNNKGAISLGRGRAGGSVSAPVWGQYISEVFRTKKPAKFIFRR